MIECHGTPEQRGQLFGLLFLTSAQRERYRVSEETISYVLAFFAAVQEKGDPLNLPNATFNVGFAYLWNGNLGNAETYLHQALTLSEQIGNLYTQVQSLSYLSCVYRMRGDINSTEQAVIRCIQLAQQTGQLDYIAQCQGHAAWLALRRGDLSEAEAKARAALTGKGSSAYVMRWMALFPLMSIEMHHDYLSQVVDRAKDLLEPARVHLPDPLNDALQNAIRCWDQDDSIATRSMLEHALTLAQEFHYL